MTAMRKVWEEIWQGHKSFSFMWNKIWYESLNSKRTRKDIADTEKKKREKERSEVKNMKTKSAL